jgi:glucosamine 6-phosphate synthetase-like amidotransferase/phosphosugar isomerase protein
MKSAEVTEQGQHTLSEIFSQPQCWSACLRKLATSAELHAATQLARPGAEWIFAGCGTSYYLAQAAAASFSYLKLPARAVPASDLLMYPALTLHAGRDYIPVVISRSGRTSEAIRAAQMLEKETNLRHHRHHLRRGPAAGIVMQRDLEASRRRRAKHGYDPIVYVHVAGVAISGGDRLWQ